MFDLISEFNKTVAEHNVDWVAKGFAFRDETIYPIGYDTKLLGRIFEMLTEPLLKEIADDFGFTLTTPDKQNYYPDFALTPQNEEGNRIAVDVKSTYRKHLKRAGIAPYKFTLGSYASFLRDGRKNILYPYNQFCKHYVIGFVYDRNDEIESARPCYPLNQLKEIPEPYSNVEFFIQEKYRISDFTTGSGNTENIGTISSNSISPFTQGSGPFSKMGNDAFELYWRNYPKYTAKEKSYTDFQGFRRWVETNVIEIDSSLRDRILSYGDVVNDSRGDRK